VKGRGKRLTVIALAIVCIAAAVPALAFDITRNNVAAEKGRRASGTPDLASEKSNEAATRYRIDPLNYNERWASMFGSAVRVSNRLSLFADYQYDQWASHSSASDTSFRAWENYRVTLGCVVQY
jgi:hypothetical protein